MSVEFLKYKGKPLVRNKNTIYYGDMADSHVVMLNIVNTKTVEGHKIPDKVTIQLMNTDTDIDPKNVVEKHSEKNGIYNAMDIASIWLKRAIQK